MEIKNYKSRLIDKKIELYLKIFGSILIEGPKWCGKTWSARHNAKSEFLLADSKGNFNNKKMAMMDPDLALKGEYPHLIDEWQEVTSIWDAVRNSVDADNVKGKFILTGSTSVDKSKYIHSGCGRIARIRMRPMSLFESGYSNGKVSLKDICNNAAPSLMTGEVELERLLKYIIIGGWPSISDPNVKENYYIAREYINAVINEDIYKTDSVKRDKHKVELLLRSLARNEATTVTNKKLKEDIKEKDFDDISIDTVTD